MSSPSPPRKTVRTRICIISDTHCHLPPIPPCDLLIHCGDLTYSGRLAELRAQFQHIASAPAHLKLVIPGNHDITLDRAYYARNGAFMHDDGEDEVVLEDLDACVGMWTGEEARARNVKLLLDEGVGVHEIGSNGARFGVYASAYQPEFCDWAFAYWRHEDRFNDRGHLSSHLSGREGSNDDPEVDGVVSVGGNWVPDFPEVDLMITHGPPHGILDRTTDGGKVGCQHLLRAVGRAKPLLHCFGHIHEAWGNARMEWGRGNREDDTMADGFANGSYQVKSTARDRDWTAMYQYRDLTNEGREPLAWGEATEFVNASIMNVRYQPVQLPWLVDIDLPVRDAG